MVRKRTLTSIGAALAVAALLPSATRTQETPTSSPAGLYHQTLQLYCVGCHSGPTPFAGLNLEPMDPANFQANGAIWEKMMRKLRDREMPPAGMPRPRRQHAR